MIRYKKRRNKLTRIVPQNKTGGKFQLSAKPGLQTLLVTTTLVVAAKDEEVVVDGYLLERELELSAFLETQGVTDTVAVSRGAGNVFELAHQLRLKGETLPLLTKVVAAETVPSKKRLFSNLMRGPLTLGVMALMMLGLAFYQNAFTSIGAPGWTLLLGLSMGTILVSAAMQVLGWQLAMLANPKDKSGVRFILRGGLALSLGLAGLVTLILEGIALWLEVPLSGMIALGIGCVGLTWLMLLSGSLALMGSPFLAGGLLALAFGLTALAYNFGLAEYGLFPTLIGGYWLVCTLLNVAIAFKLHEARAKKKKEKTPVYLPPKGQFFYKALPYLGYGTFSVGYVLTGQLCGWTGSLPEGWFWDNAIKTLTLVHLLGLMSLVLSQGVTESALQSFWNTMFKIQKEVAFNDYSAITRSVWSFLKRYLRLLLLCQFLIALFLIGFGTWAWPELGLDLIFGPLHMPMLLAVLLGYSLLAWGLFECGLLLTLAQPWVAVRALLIATGVQLVSGVTLGWVSSFEVSVVSVVIGGICLVLLTHQGLSRLLSPASYGLYQAF
ncbi:MAG: hypothetical protein HXX20_01075 [Chloroflexi bacterium]|nr:hypothetical protein [Chloroflexota bacterium]